MILVARCRHCNTSRVWEQLPDGRVLPPLTDVGAGAKRYPYPCRVARGKVQQAGPRSAAEGQRVGSIESCEPLILTPGERMVRELAGMRKTRKRRV